MEIPFDFGYKLVSFLSLSYEIVTLCKAHKTIDIILFCEDLIPTLHTTKCNTIHSSVSQEKPAKVEKIKE